MKLYKRRSLHLESVTNSLSHWLSQIAGTLSMQRCYQFPGMITRYLICHSRDFEALYVNCYFDHMHMLICAI